jgi:uncharacterized protein YcbK (DUF882 family)
MIGGTRTTQDAVANGDTRTITIMHMHTKEETTATFRRDGRYDGAALDKLNRALRDWRNDDVIKMDPRLFDVAWEVHREIGSGEPFHVVSAYRSPATNSMLRRRSRGVAKHSQHMLGKAMDFYLPDVSPSRIREIGMRLQRGGVGYYPTAYTPFIHLDVGSVRSWPRMSRDQLARIFPSGKTVHLPSDGEPMEGYEIAKAEILARGGSVGGYAAADLDEGAIIASGSRSSFWAALFGGGNNDEEEARPTRGGRRGIVASRQAAPSTALAYAPADNDPLGRFSTPQTAAQTQAQVVPLRERVASRGRNRGRTETPDDAETRVASLATTPATSPAPPGRTVTGQTAESKNADIPATAEKATQANIVFAPLPLSRPRLLQMPLPSAGQVQVAALAGDGSATENLAGAKLVSAPAPPSRPVELASALPDTSLANASIRVAQTPAGDARPAPSEAAASATGRLVAISHPAPPERPRLGETELVAMAPASTAALTRTPANFTSNERDALSQLFANTRPAATKQPPRVTTTKASPVSDVVGPVVQNDSPAASLGFSKPAKGNAARPEIRTDRFTGPAVTPLSTSFIQQ